MAEIKMSYIFIEKQKHESKEMQEILLEVIDDAVQERTSDTIMVNDVEIEYRIIQKTKSKRCFLEMSSTDRVNKAIAALQVIDDAIFKSSQQKYYHSIQKDLYEGLRYESGDITVLELVKKYVDQKRGVRHNTKANYNFVINIIAKEEFGQKRIDKVKLSDAKAWLIKLQDDGRGYSTIHTVRGVVRPAFQMAVDDDLIRKNPFEFQLNTVVVKDSVTREAISRAEERAFLKFVKEDKHFAKYYDGMFILFKTGLRISEFCGLTISDIDFKNNRINVDHQLQRTRDMRYIIEDTKTACGVRMIPMTPEVKECFERIIGSRPKPKVEPMIDGRCGFLFLDKNEMPMVDLHWEKYFQHVVEKYNRIYRVQLPKITPHVCRHTYCSNMAKAGMNPKTLQYLMGHSDIGVTLNTYTHFKFEDAQAEVLLMDESCRKKSS